MKTFFAGCVFALALSGCTTIQPVFGPVVYDPAHMEIVGPAAATVSRLYILGTGPSDETTLAQAAVDKAAKSVGADTLINIVADDQKTYMVLFYTHELSVKGLAIRYKK